MDRSDPNYAFTDAGLEREIAKIEARPFAVSDSTTASPPGVFPVAQPGQPSTPGVGIPPHLAQQFAQQSGYGGGYGGAQPVAPPETEGGDWTSRLRAAEEQAQRLLSENQQMRQTFGQVASAAAQLEYSQQRERWEQLAPEDALREQERYYQARMAQQAQQAQQAVGQLQQATLESLKESFTQKLFTEDYPNLQQEQRDAILSIADPDSRAALAGAYSRLNDQITQLGLANATAIHVASGAGRVGGGLPTAMAHPSTVDQSDPLAILRATPWQSTR